MATIVKLKNSVTTTAAPTTLVQGEVAVNVTDKKVWVGNAASGVVQILGAGATISGTDVAYTGTLTGGTGIVNLGSGQFYKDASGNIGVGTASPATKLHVYGSGANSRLENSGATNSTQFTVKNTVGTVTLGLDSSTGSGFGVANGAVLWYDAAQPLAFATNNTERMRIDSSGNVGIGTSSPTDNLYISRATNAAGGISVVNTNNAQASQIAQLYLQGGDNAYAQIKLQANSVNSSIRGNSDGSLAFLSSTTERMRIDSSGNVGIGVTPVSQNGKVLQIDGGATAADLRLTNTATGSARNNGILLGLSGSDAYLYNFENAFMAFGTNATEWMRISSSGDVNIGATSNGFGAKLGVTSTAAFPLAVITSQVAGTAFNKNTDGAGNQILITSNNSFNYGVFGVASANGTSGGDVFTLGYTPSGGSAATQVLSWSPNRIVTMGGYGAGAATFSAAGVISSVSDETWKTKDGVPTNPDAMLQKLEAGYWFYNEEKAPIFGKDRQLGFYAQNVHEAIGEEAAPTPEEGKPWGYYDRSVLAIAVMSLKNALSTIEDLKQRIATLENK